MNINIHGEYTFTKDNKVILKKHNLITLLGESFFMNRWCNDYFEPLDYICLGTSNIPAEKKDTSLGNETIRKKCTKTVNLKKKIIHLQATFTSDEIKNTSEIGVSNDKLLISHDIYEPIDDYFLNNDEGNYSDITVDYKFVIETGSIHTKWILTEITRKVYDEDGEPVLDDDNKQVTEKVPNVYYRTEHDTVVGVLEEKSGNGYIQVYSFDDLVAGTYYYDKINRNIYLIHSSLKNPNTTKDIIVKTRG